MSEHPIEGLMKTAMNSIQDMVDVNTIIGEPIETAGDIMIIPISKVCFGFAAGGSEFNSETLDEYKKKEKEEEMQYRLPFGGGSGAGVTINPVAFLVINKDTIKLMPINHTSTLDRIVDYVPDIINKFCKKDEEVEEMEEDVPEETTTTTIETKTIKTEIPKENADYLEDE
ncbi:MAG: GerW family sporulation protein [Clostridia bacterium]|nr:GerW family sporulation protein [Clostridia bacterium]